MSDYTNKERKLKIIQQWQTFGRLHSELLNDDVYESVKTYGITSLQSYVYWAEIEKKENKIDFSVYDELVEKIPKHNLKWTPFIILGPNYSVPQWVHISKESVYAKCIEHNRECDIQSIWNPFIPKYIERFIKLLSERYGKSNIIESVLLGISGVWGEAIYPSSDGVYRIGHKHSGWWCNDKYAKRDFIKSCKTEFDNIHSLNKSWGTGFKDFESITWPVKQISLTIDIAYRIAHRVWSKLLNIRDSSLYYYLEKIFERRLFDGKMSDVKEKNRYLFFVKWYLDSMTAFADKWLKMAKKYFPEDSVYLVTGGYGHVITGADFTTQAKISAKNNCGVRVTNMVSDYSGSFVNKSLISTAAEYYRATIQTEETIETSPDEVKMRIFDHASGNIDGLYFKTLFGIDYGAKVSCTNKSDNGIPIGKPSKVADNLLLNYKYLFFGQRKTEVALLLANSSFTISPQLLNLNYELGKMLRKYIDFDIIDENLIEDSILSRYRFLISFSNPIINERILERIEDWLKEGGILLYSMCFAKYRLFEYQQGDKNINSSGNSYHAISKGYFMGIEERKVKKFTEEITRTLFNEEGKYPWPSVYPHSKNPTEVYFIKSDSSLILYNDSTRSIEEKIYNNKNKVSSFLLEPKEIKILPLER